MFQGRPLLAGATALLLAAHGGAAAPQDTGFFGPDQGFEIQPEVDVYVHVADGTRLLLQVQETSIPGDGFSSIAVGGFVDWFAAPFVRSLVSPDQALTRALNLRAGVRYSGTLDPGLGDETIADAVCDRLVHNAHREKLGGESIGKTQGNLTTAQKTAK